MALAKVDGILLNNDKIRQEQLKRVYWQDKQYTDFGGEFVRNVSIGTKEVSPIGKGRDLLYHTFDGSTDFSHEMLRKYMSNGVNHEIYEDAQIPDGKRYRWEGDYFEDFEPYNTRQKVAEIKLLEGERQISFANEGRFREEKYLTPALLNVYGSKLAADATIIENSVVTGRMDGILNVGTGRLADIAETTAATFVHDYSEAIKKANNNEGAGFKNLAKNVENVISEREKGKDNSKNWKTPLEKYVNIEKDANFEGRINVNSSAQTINTNKERNVSLIYSENDDNDNRVISDIKGTVDTITAKGDIRSDSVYGDIFRQIPKQNRSLLSKTNDLFNAHKISTLIGRFHTTKEVDREQSIVDSAISSKYGNSHGRNLISKRAENGGAHETNGYDNPYCRVWTYHHQYDKVSKTIRPFNNDKGESVNPRENNPYKTVYSDENGKAITDLDGIKYLEKNTVLGKNGFVNIVPKKNGKCEQTVEIKQCMFSIENLAWKDVPRKDAYISDEQRGPNGGRIMWFPPYDLNFQESVNVNWNQNNFIGRGEPVFTYTNTSRNGVLSFVVLVDHPSIVDNIPKRNIGNDILTEDDVLRFFAGCDIPEGFTKDGSCEFDVAENNKKKSDEPENAVSNDSGRSIKFSVYFPNNYSGNGVQAPKEDWKKNGASDVLWYCYLLFGYNDVIPTRGGGDVWGYEIEDNKRYGVTDLDYSGGTEVAVITNPEEKGEGVVEGVSYRYRVDYDFRQKLVNEDKNNVSRGMEYDTSNYIDSASYALNNSTEESSGSSVYAFSEIIASLYEARPNLFKGNEDEKYFMEYKLDNIASPISVVTELFEDAKRISKIKIVGGATNQNSKNSKLLAERRAYTLKNFLKKFVADENIFSVTTALTEELIDPTTVNTREAKHQRRVTVEIIYDTPEITQTGSTAEATNETGKTETVAYKIAKEVVIPDRYETESEYFYGLEKDSPLVYKKLVEKFKYFNPAFHSISPEGFNARLTFLQQCTRQGHTFEASDKNGFAKTAGNLAFGRMPVCVLRLGDFLNTKMIINGMSINYDAQGPMQWDLNPEGIGVQPMYAKISLQVTILGGQSLDGPINRLQNAVTFNYYANTGVYDNRADRIDLSSAIVNPAKEGEVISATKETVVVDDSDYVNSTITYRHVFTPAPNIVSKSNNSKK